jgi:ArsR family transcriptional regulator, arsenate/arsenite/antimonite-responsive transcriptional repressor
LICLGEYEEIVPSAIATNRGMPQLDTLFRGLADPTRIRLLNVLSAGQLCVCDLVDLLDLPQSTVSRHLRRLHHARLVQCTRDWKYAHYRLAEPASAVHERVLACVHSCFHEVSDLKRERAQAVARVRAAKPC